MPDEELERDESEKQEVVKEPESFRDDEEGVDETGN